MKIPRTYFVFTILLGVLSLLLVGCGAMGGGLVGSGNVVTEERAVDDFDSIDFNYVGEMIVIQGDEPSVVIEGDDNVVDNIETYVRGNTLIIDTKKNHLFGGLRSFKKLTFTVTTPDLDEINLAGSGEVSADAFTTEKLKIELSGAGSMSLAQIQTDEFDAELSGAGSMTIAQIQTDEFDIELSGAGSIDVAGATQSLVVDLNGLGNMDAGSFASDTVEVNIDGAGSATVWARETLDANISGAGSVDYYGSPSVTRNVSGVGGIDSLGEKE